MAPETLEYWINREIPQWLDKCGSYENFMRAYPSAAASNEFKAIAWGMAKERWKPNDETQIKGR